MQLATKEFLAEIDRMAEERKTAIRSSKSEYPTTGTVYYVSTEGNDDNDGKSADTPIKTLEKVSALEYNPGDTVLFKRGETFRGKMLAKEGVTYSAYGEGAKPIISGSPENMAYPECWTLLDGTENIWIYKKELQDVGGICFDEGKTAGTKILPKYFGGMYRNEDGTPFDPTKDMSCDLAFFSCLGNDTPRWTPDTVNAAGRFYLRCDKGNPGEVFDSIEILTRGANIGVRGDNVTIDNLCILHCGCHGIGTGSRAGLTVRNCELGWIGGCIQFYHQNGNMTRFGNGIEIYVSCRDFTVENCYIYQVYDAGVTHQYKSDRIGETVCNMENVLYKNNLIEFCIYSIEYFLEQAGNDEQVMKNILMTGNICRFSGYGWGSYPSRAAHIKGWDHRNRSENFVIENNIFDRSRSMLLHIGVQEEKHLPVMRNNTYIQLADNPKFTLGRYAERGGDKFIYSHDMIAYNNDDVEKFNSEHMHDTGKFYYVTEEPTFEGRWPSGEQG